MNARRLLNRRKEILSTMPALEESIRGSLVIMNRSCGKPNCRCQKGRKHKGLYLSQSHNGKTRMFYIPQRSKDKAHQYVKNYQKIKSISNRLSEINIKLFTGR